MTTSDNNTTPQVFVRKASGLIRTAGVWDVLFYNITFVSIGLVALLQIMYGYPFYAGGNVPLSIVVTIGLVIPICLCYAFLSSAMPRSGGDYVFVSRILGAPFGMASSLNQTIWWWFYGSIPAVFLVWYGLVPFFRTMSIYTGNSGLMSISNWCAGDVGTFICGSALILGLTAIFCVGTRTYFKVQNVLIMIAIVGTVVTIVVLATKGQAETANGFNEHLRGLSGLKDPVGFVRESAVENGFGGLMPFSMFWTLMMCSWSFMNMGYSNSSAYIGSEVKDARKVQLWSMPLTLLVAGGTALVIILLAQKAIGAEFLAQLGWADPAGLGLSSAPLFTEIASFAANNVWVAFIIMFGFIFWSYSYAPGQILNSSRNMFAYALDGLFPAWFKKINPKTATPVNTILFIGFAQVVSLSIFVFTDLLTFVFGMVGMCLTFASVSVAAALFPYRLPEVFETSAVNQRIGRVPVITIIGVIAFSVCALMIFVYIRDPNAGMNKGLIAFNFGVYLSGFVVFYLAKYIRSRQNVDVTLSFKQIPEE